MENGERRTENQGKRIKKILYSIQYIHYEHSIMHLGKRIDG